LFALLLDAQEGFRCGVTQLIAKLYEMQVITTNCQNKLPHRKSFQEACDKLPAEIILQQLRKSHNVEYSASGTTYKGLKVIIPDGTMNSMSVNEETIAKYGEGRGHYVQAQAVGFYELSTGTFQDYRLAHADRAERPIALEHMADNTTRSLELGDAGFTGMAFIVVCLAMGHELLSKFKAKLLREKFLKSGKRSAIYEIKLTRTHLMNHPDYQHMVGQILKVRLVRTRGTTKLKSQVLISTLLDEKEYTWQELSKLYQQRYTVELAFRHLKVKMRIEHIRKQKINKIEQSIYSAVTLFNLAATIRNRVRQPTIIPPKAGIKMHCFTLCIDYTIKFCKACVIKIHGDKTVLNRCLKAIRGCTYIYKPWRSEPRICHTSPSKFTAQRGGHIQQELDAAKFLKTEFKILCKAYGQKEEKSA